MYGRDGRNASNLVLLWPAAAATAVSEMVALWARQWTDLAVGPSDSTEAAREPDWTTPHRVVLELKTARLHDFSIGEEGPAALICAPFALHGATVADFAPGYSLVAALHEAGLHRLYVAEWRSATPDMRFLGIDDYLASLNVMVDAVGTSVDLIGLCQGGWLSLMYAARFPAKVRKLVLAGAPVDVRAAPSGLSALADGSPLPVFHELIRLGDGVVPGHKVLTLWGPPTVDRYEIHELLQSDAAEDSAAFASLAARFQIWYVWTVNLPGTYFLEVVDKFYKQNALATGTFVALGRTIDLAAVTAPLFLLAARDDELVAPAQLFAAQNLVGTPAHDVHQALAPSRHVGLFMGKAVLQTVWPNIASFLKM
jgi:poly(3-hydroxybutyrate) depolymerase